MGPTAAHSTLSPPLSLPPHRSLSSLSQTTRMTSAPGAPSSATGVDPAAGALLLLRRRPLLLRRRRGSGSRRSPCPPPPAPDAHSSTAAGADTTAWRSPPRLRVADRPVLRERATPPPLQISRRRRHRWANSGHVGERRMAVGRSLRQGASAGGGRGVSECGGACPGYSRRNQAPAVHALGVSSPCPRRRCEHPRKDAQSLAGEQKVRFSFLSPPWHARAKRHARAL
uniref:Uncharacterized protein n=1 Tax=Oryza brachyantha TaxID=4533 RepID=J3MDZ8_ORYBR